MAKHARHYRKKAGNSAETATKKKSHRVLKWLLFVILIILFAGAAYGVHMYIQAKTALDKTYSSVDKKEETKASKKIAKRDPLSILLLGTDTGDEGRTEVNGNSDTIIVATVNQGTKKTTLTSIPRDTLAEMVGTSNFNFTRINAANNIGGPKMALNSVSSLLNVPLTYYVSVNMTGLKQIVDAVGGIDVDVSLEFTFNASTFKKGKMHLNGQQALDYSRMRKEDPENDYGRQKRQRQVITAVVKSASSVGTLANFQELLTAVSANMQTNFTTSQMIDIFKNYRVAAQTISSDYVKGVNAWSGSAAIQVASTTELQRISDAIRSELGLSQETLNNTVTKENELNAASGFIYENPTIEQNFTVYDLN
ncbi:LCP family glycopolymer transferase [Lapidilactobacillus luobeiensis]|uniref:LCP family glycopolymer transferase n=1 Tax=Lapidilactobacillus luobeiensis TaxID=2950371 RepID=UPI0021C3972B|nr:LCP family protein [Lapidilactobacillus luobeiensis]